jgi:hypothetical protein
MSLKEPSVPMIVRHFLTLNLMYNGGGKEFHMEKKKPMQISEPSSLEKMEGGKTSS